ncbi:myelin-oligodendrocyte glycoprotein-like [Poecilia reticulata]|uniref:Myelin-oligodendrocyte glycoprotein-like n=1 Tax=Poecilia reticulata TaxID=8081 RepID=A0A3P9MY57_POERE|nr:PREDICTED: myelin-oligodendrocyte glycoprotein-like [Poecilia reticulata]
MFYLLCFVFEAILIEGYLCPSGQPGQLEAFTGGNVVLPCSLNIHPSDDVQTVEWTKLVAGQKPVVVFLYRHGCETFEMKDPDFEYRTSLIMREVKNGNVSLRISGVKPSDGGTYQCLTIQNDGRRQEAKVELVVAPGEESTTTTILICVALAVSHLFNLLLMLYLLVTTKRTNSDGEKPSEQKDKLDQTMMTDFGKSNSLLNQLSLTENRQNCILAELNKQRRKADTIQIDDSRSWNRPACQHNHPTTSQSSTGSSLDSWETRSLMSDPDAEAENSPGDQQPNRA